MDCLPDNEQWHEQEGFVKLALYVEDEDITREVLWCSPLEDGQFRVGNTPFFTKEVCLDDIIEAELGDDGNYRLTRVVSREREAMFLMYMVPNDPETHEKWLKAFGDGCEKIDVKAERVVDGFIAAAIPRGHGDAFVTLVLGIAEDVGMQMKLFGELECS